MRFATVAPVVFLGLWSGGYAVAKIALEDGEPLTILALRYACALVLLVALAVLLRPRWPDSRSAYGHLAVVGVLIQVVYFGGSYLAFSLGAAAGTLALIVSLQPLVVGVFAPLVGEVVGAIRWLGLALGFGGAGIVVAARSTVEVVSAGELVAAVVALVGMSAAALYERRFGLAHHPVPANVVQYAVGLLVLVPAAALLEDGQVAVTGSFVAAMAYLVIGNSLIAISLLLAMVRRGEAARVSALFFLVPPVAALIAWILIDESMPVGAWPGLALAAAGVYLATRVRSSE